MTSKKTIPILYFIFYLIGIIFFIVGIWNFILRDYFGGILFVVLALLITLPLKKEKEKSKSVLQFLMRWNIMLAILLVGSQIVFFFSSLSISDASANLTNLFVIYLLFLIVKAGITYKTKQNKK